MHIAKKHQINKMRVTSVAVARLLDYITPFVVAGISTGELDDLCNKFTINELHVLPANLGYKGYPKTICTSINEVVCHGIPDYNRILKDGDVMNIDVAVKFNNVYGDASRMFMIGNVSDQAKLLVDETKTALELAIEIIKPGVDLNEIGKVIQTHAKKFNFGVVENYCGHGIGKQYHEWPNIAHYDLGHKTGIRLHEGMIFTIEPMLTALPDANNHVLNDKWTVVTNNNCLSAQWEHTVLVTAVGVQILTL